MRKQEDLEVMKKQTDKLLKTRSRTEKQSSYKHQQIQLRTATNPANYTNFRQTAAM